MNCLDASARYSESKRKDCNESSAKEILTLQASVLYYLIYIFSYVLVMSHNQEMYKL